MCSHAQPGCLTRGAPPAEHRKAAPLTDSLTITQVGGGKSTDEVGGSGVSGGGVLSWLVSCVLRGGCEAFAMDALRHVCAAEGAHPAAPPLLLFVRDVDSTLVAQPERWDAFLAAFADSTPSTSTASATSLSAQAADAHHSSHSDNLLLASPHHLQLSPPPSPPMLLLAGTSLGDCNGGGSGGGGGALPQWLEEMAWGGAEERTSADSSSHGVAADSIHDSTLGVVPRVRPVSSWGGERTDVRRVLAALCAVHVRLRAPGEGAAGAAAHREALAADAEEHVAAVNWRRVQAAVRSGGAAASTGSLVRVVSFHFRNTAFVKHEPHVLSLRAREQGEAQWKFWLWSHLAVFSIPHTALLFTCSCLPTC